MEKLTYGAWVTYAAFESFTGETVRLQGHPNGYRITRTLDSVQHCTDTVDRTPAIREFARMIWMERERDRHEILINLPGWLQTDLSMEMENWNQHLNEYA